MSVLLGALSFVGRSAQSVLTGSFLPVVKALTKNPIAEAVSFTTNKDHILKGTALLAGGIAIANSAWSLISFAQDLRREGELTSPNALQTGHRFTSRKASKACLDASIIGLGSSGVMALSGLLSAPLAAISPVAIPLITVASSVAGLGSMVYRSVKKLSMNLPFNPNWSLGLLTLGKPAFKVTDPLSPYYGFSTFQQQAIQKRQFEDMNLSGDPGLYAQMRDSLVRKGSKFLGIT